MEKKPRATTSRDSDKYIIRFVDGLKDRIEEASAANNRSINAEINSRLQSSFIEPGTAVQFSRADDASEALFANIRRLREEGESKDATIESLRREIALRAESTVEQKKLLQTQNTLIVSLEGHIVDLVRQVPEELVTDEMRRLVMTCNYDLAIEHALDHARSSHKSLDEIEDARITAMKIPVVVRGKTTEVRVNRERTEILDANGKSTSASKSK